MTQTEQFNALYACDGYFIPRPNETNEQAFKRAKKEYEMALTKCIKNVNDLTFEKFEKFKKLK